MQNFLYTLVASLLLTLSPVIAQDDIAVAPPPAKEDYFKPGIAPVSSAPGANVTIVYFMDYQCPACRKYTPDVSSVFGADRKLKIIYRDTPIFGPNSVEAAKYAIASTYQGKHDAFHRALMAQKLPLDDDAIKAAAAKAGIDWARLVEDRAAHAKAIDAQIAQNKNLSEAAGISGTPAFIIGDKLADGALDAQGLRAEIADARKSAPTAAQPAPAPTSASASTTQPLPVPEVAKVDDDENPAPSDQDAGSPPVAAARPPEPMFEAAPSTSATRRAEASESPHGLLVALVAGVVLLLAGAAALVLRRRRRPD